MPTVTLVTNDNILMRQPPGFEQVGPNGEELVCKLNKSFYGLRQAGREWNSLLNDWLTSSKWKLKRCRRITVSTTPMSAARS